MNKVEHAEYTLAMMPKHQTCQSSNDTILVRPGDTLTYFGKKGTRTYIIQAEQSCDNFISVCDQSEIPVTQHLSQTFFGVVCQGIMYKMMVETSEN